MNDFEKEKEEQSERFMYEKTITVLFFSLYMVSTLIASLLISSGKGSGYVFGLLLGTTIAMFLFIPYITKTDRNYLITNAIFFTIYPALCDSYIFKIFMILNYILFSLKFTMFITKTYLTEVKENC